MRDFCWIDPAFRDMVVRHGLNDLAALYTRAGGRLRAGDRRGRDSLRLELPGDRDASHTVLLKRERTTRLKDLLAQLVRGGGIRTSPRWELEVSWIFAAAGIGCPRPIACVESGFWPALSCLVLEESPHATP